MKYLVAVLITISGQAMATDYSALQNWANSVYKPVATSQPSTPSNCVIIPVKSITGEVRYIVRCN